MPRKRVKSIQNKLKLLIATTSGIALVVAGAAILAHGFSLARWSKIRQLYSLGNVVASNSTATLMFNQSDAAKDLLDSLRNQPTIEHACLVTADNQILASYHKSDDRTYEPPLPLRVGHSVAPGGYIDVSLPVREDGEVLGMLFIRASTSDLRDQMVQNVTIVGGVIATALIISILVASRLQRLVSKPILQLATTAQRISSAGDYSIRAQSRSDDEIGVLYLEFNRMLDQIQDGECQLREARDELEMRVEERTEQLSRVNAELHHQMAQRERAAQQLEDSNRTIQLLQNITVAANEAEDTETAIQRSLEHICAFMKWPAGFAYLWQTDPPGLVPADLRFVAPEFAGLGDAFAAVASVGAGTIAYASVATGRPAWAEDLNQNRAAVAYSCDGFSVASAVALPIHVRGEVVAVLEFLGRHAGRPDQRVLGAARHLGHQLGRVFERRRAETERERLHRQLLDTSHRAGKAEIATGVLHNVGNVLNSVNVSAHLVADTLKASKLDSLHRLNQLLAEHESDLTEFLLSDERGRMLPAYLRKLTDALAGERGRAVEEVQSLLEHLQHIKAVVATQQSYAGVAGVAEPLCLEQLVADAEKLTAASFHKYGIELVHDFDALPEMLIEKQKVLQILVNLIKNAGDSVVPQRNTDRRVTLRLRRAGADRVRIEVSDNGQGIDHANLTRIFSHGFTTKPNGHGFGLHASANAAVEMDGSLSAASPGPGLGATFTLELPLQPAAELAVS